MTRILEVEDFDAMLIFVRTKTATVELAEKLEARGYSSAALNGDMSQALRERTIERLKAKSLDVVVATDVAARGLDVQRISHVVNYDVPHDIEAYVHRIGRTGRAGRSGEAILFVTPREKRMLHAIEKATKQKITPLQLPTREEVTDRRVAQFKQQISDTIEAEELGLFERLVEQYQQEHNIGTTEIAAALAYLAQRERPLVVKEKAERPERKDKERRAGKPTRLKSRQELDMVRYRIEVGREHGVMPKNIVGAIANEAGMDSRYIGHIKLHDFYSTVDLPDGMPKEIYHHLKNVRICNRKLNISLLGNGAEGTGYQGKAKKKNRAAQHPLGKRFG